jgi:hypothetical protein
VNRLIVLIFASLGVMVFSAVGVKETLGLPLDEIEIVRKRRDDDDDDGGYVVAVVVAFFGGFYVSAWRLQVRRGAVRCYY